MIINNQILKRKKIIQHFFLLFLTVVILSIGTAIGRHYIFDTSYIIRVDCRGKEITVDTIKEWEKKQKNGSLGLLRIVGWRIDNQKMISSVSTGRKQKTQIFCVYGSMELIEPAKIQCGRYGLPVEEGYCVLSEKLACELFGNTNIAGEQIIIEQNIFPVIGVIKKEEEILFLPIKEGNIEVLAVEFNNRININKKFKDLTGFPP